MTCLRALNDLVSRAEVVLECKEIALCDFMEIEGAFDNNFNVLIGMAIRGDWLLRSSADGLVVFSSPETEILLSYLVPKKSIRRVFASVEMVVGDQRITFTNKCT